jgi:hypothetical protein
MPIYCEKPDTTGPISYKNFLVLPRLPTSSVLLRITYASIDYHGEFVSVDDPDPKKRELAYEAPPDYADLSYSTCYFLVSELES